MSEPNNKDGDGSEPRGRRRVLRRVAHDTHGHATMEWAEVPDDRSQFFDRQPLSVEGEPPPEPKPKRTDLRRLDEVIKARRLAEENKKAGDRKSGFWSLFGK